MVFSSAISLFFFVPIVFLLDRRLSDVDTKNTWLRTLGQMLMIGD